MPVRRRRPGFRDAYLDHERLTAQLHAWTEPVPSLCRMTSTGTRGGTVACDLVRGTGALDVRIGSRRAGFVTTGIAAV